MKKYIISREAGRLFAARRTKLKLTQQQLGTTLGMTRSSVSSIENGSQAIVIDMLPDLCEALKLDMGGVMRDAVASARRKNKMQTESKEVVKIRSLVNNSKQNRNGGDRG